MHAGWQGYSRVARHIEKTGKSRDRIACGLGQTFRGNTHSAKLWGDCRGGGGQKRIHILKNPLHLSAVNCKHSFCANIMFGQ